MIRVVGCNHRSAPVSLRERLAFDDAAARDALRRFADRFPGTEAVLLSTCNRIELYWSRPDDGSPRSDEATAFLIGCHDVPADDFAETFYGYEAIEAVRHLFCVTSSLDSMVLGESQILGQAKAAFERARDVGTVGRGLGPAFECAFRCAKDVHTKTAIALGKASVGSTAVDLARQVFSRFADKKVLVVGAGKMSELILTHLLTTRPGELWVANRTQVRAVAQLERVRQRHDVPGRVIGYEQWRDALADVDVVITSTGSREPILTADALRDVLPLRRYRPLLLIDIAVPRNIDPAAGELDGVYLYNIDDLQAVSEAAIRQRQGALAECHAMIEDHVRQYAEQCAERDLAPVIADLQRRLGDLAEAELQWLYPKLQSASAHDRALVRQLLHRVTRKILHGPMHLLHERSADGSPQACVELLRAMFGLEARKPEPPPPPEKKC